MDYIDEMDEKNWIPACAGMTGAVEMTGVGIDEIDD